MSRLAAIARFDGAPVAHDQLDLIVGFGVSPPAVRKVWQGPSVALATAEATSGRLFRDNSSGVVVALDGELHALKELISALIAANCPPRSKEPAELIARAYEAWREECISRLTGEFAFTLWDPHLRSLACGRDAGGVRPLFYAEAPDGSVRVATRASQLLCDPSWQRRPDLEGLVDFLINEGGYDAQRTPWRRIQRVPAGHMVSFDARGRRLRQWSPIEEFTANPKQGDPVEAFMFALCESLRDRLGGTSQAGISLSGGYDSGTIFLLWQWLRSRGEALPAPWTSTHYWEYPESDEREEVHALLSRWPATSTFVGFEGRELLSGIEEHVRDLGLPDPAFGWCCLRRQMAAAKAAGVELVVTGEGGNYVAEGSPLRAADLVLAKRLRDAKKQLEIVAHERRRPARELLWPVVLRPTLAAVFPGLRKPTRWLRRAHYAANFGPPFLAPKARALWMDMLAASRDVFWPPGFGSLAARDTAERLVRLLDLTFPVPQAPELEGVRMTAPFLDRRVMRTGLLALAREAGPGSSRTLLAETLERTVGQRLPGNYAHITRGVHDGLRARLRSDPDLFKAPTLAELGLVDRKRLERFVATYAAGNQAGFIFLFRLVSLEAWARRWLGPQAACCSTISRSHAIQTTDRRSDYGSG